MGATVRCTLFCFFHSLLSAPRLSPCVPLMRFFFLHALCCFSSSSAENVLLFFYLGSLSTVASWRGRRKGERGLDCGRFHGRPKGASGECLAECPGLRAGLLRVRRRLVVGRARWGRDCCLLDSGDGSETCLFSPDGKSCSLHLLFLPPPSLPVSFPAPPSSPRGDGGRVLSVT